MDKLKQSFFSSIRPLRFNVRVEWAPAARNGPHAGTRKKDKREISAGFNSMGLMESQQSQLLGFCWKRNLKFNSPSWVDALARSGFD